MKILKTLLLLNFLFFYVLTGIRKKILKRSNQKSKIILLNSKKNSKSSSEEALEDLQIKKHTKSSTENLYNKEKEEILSKTGSIIKKETEKLNKREKSLTNLDTDTKNFSIPDSESMIKEEIESNIKSGAESLSISDTESLNLSKIKSNSKSITKSKSQISEEDEVVSEADLQTQRIIINKKKTLLKDLQDFENTKECEAFIKIKVTLNQLNEPINNIMKYSTVGENIQNILNRLGDKNYNNLSKRIIATIHKIFSEIKLKRNMNYNFLDGKILGKYFANILYNGEKGYCATVTSVGFVILRLLGHGFLSYNNLREFFHSLFYFVIVKGDSGVKREVTSGLTKKLFTFFIRYFINIKIDIVDKYFEFFTLKENSFRDMIDGLTDLVTLNLLFVEKNNESSLSRNNESYILFIKKWIMQFKEDIKERGAFFKLFVYMYISVLDIDQANLDSKYLSAFLKKNLDNDINSWRKHLFIINNIDLEKFKKVNITNYVIFTSFIKIKRKDWILDLFDYVNLFTEHDLIYYTEPYKIFSKFKTNKEELKKMQKTQEDDFITISDEFENMF